MGSNQPIDSIRYFTNRHFLMDLAYNDRQKDSKNAVTFYNGLSEEEFAKFKDSANWLLGVFVDPEESGIEQPEKPSDETLLEFLTHTGNRLTSLLRGLDGLPDSEEKEIRIKSVNRNLGAIERLKQMVSSGLFKPDSRDWLDVPFIFTGSFGKP